jgi:2,3-dihydroxyphenylpropionate 1,2-dioxygenase
MSLALVCMSHSPLLDLGDPPAAVRAEVDSAFEQARSFVADFDPTLVISFAPDHYNGFFYELMPPFCVGFAAESIGDYGSQAGALEVPTGIAERLAQHVLDRDVDVAISRRMLLDHGGVQPLEILLGDIAAKPVIPVFVNGVAHPFTSMRRVRLLGEAVGSFAAQLDERVLVIGSGGLSHDPPVPQWATASPTQREGLLAGRSPSAEARAARQQRVIEAARDFAAGEADILDLNPQWDEQVMTLLAEGNLEELDTWQPARMAAEAGNSAHEVRTWLAAFSALRSAGGYEVRSRFYRPIPEFIAGFGVMTAASRPPGQSGGPS